jgi:hypothetical protein
MGGRKAVTKMFVIVLPNPVPATGRVQVPETESILRSASSDTIALFTTR